VNHEVLAEIILGETHAIMGGPGILLLKTGVGMLAFVLCLGLGLKKLTGVERMLGWAFGAVAIVEISFGFAARPQIFTALFLVVELALLLRVHAGEYKWAWGIPLLFFLWINTHGGALAGFGLLGLSCGMTTLQFLFERIWKIEKPSPVASGKTVLIMWSSLIGATIGLFCNPWGPELIRWLIGSILWLRPEITEWNPTPFTADHAVFFILLGLTVVAWLCTRRARAWWEIGACAAFALLGWRALRNAPLFCFVVLALVTPHLIDALSKFSNRFERLREIFRRAEIQKLATTVFGFLAAAIVVGTFTLHKEHPFTMEVPGASYPNGAIAFMQEHQLKGKTIVFFDWGEQLLFTLPDCPPSLDGRLDTCYSRAQIAAQWKFYKDEPYDKTVFDPDAADLALLPADLRGAHSLAKHPGWQTVYYDGTAVLLARDFKRFPTLTAINLPVEGSEKVVKDHAVFADISPRGK
jgi:hypothetical protein